jgi:signal peptidase II
MKPVADLMIENSKPQSRRRRFFIFVSVALTVIVLDQWTKWLVRRDIPLGTSYLPDWLEWLSPYARFLHIENRGASFGMFQDGNVVFILLTLLIVGGILYFVTKMEDDNNWMWVAGGIYLGGAVGNLIDRLLFGAVTDFISIGTFYIFNIADASINVSVAMLVILFWLQERRPNAKDDTPPNDQNQ